MANFNVVNNGSVDITKVTKNLRRSLWCLMFALFSDSDKTHPTVAVGTTEESSWSPINSTSLPYVVIHVVTSPAVNNRVSFLILSSNEGTNADADAVGEEIIIMPMTAEASKPIIFWGNKDKVSRSGEAKCRSYYWCSGELQRRNCKALSMLWVVVKVSQFLKKRERGHAMGVTVERERVRGPWWSMVVDEVRSSGKQCCWALMLIVKCMWRASHFQAVFWRLI